MKLTLKKINKNNINLAIETARKIFPYENHKEGFWPKIAYETSIKSKDEDFKYYLASVDNEVIGITGHYVEDSNAWLGWFGILPDKRRRGYGSKVLLKTCKIVKNLGFTKLLLYTGVREEEMNAHFLYTKLGFKKYKEGVIDKNKVYYFKLELK